MWKCRSGVHTASKPCVSAKRACSDAIAKSHDSTSSSPPVFTVRLWGTAAFRNVSVIKDNNVVFSTSGARALAFTWQDQTAQKGKTSYYYVRGVQTDGQIVWVSPMWVTMP